jgi:hypothetical protein
MRRWGLVFVVGIATSGLAARAHHAIAAVYDSSRQATIEGVVTRFQFINPHPLMTVDVTGDGGKMEQWRLEFDNRSELAAVGATKDTLRAGDRVIVTGSLSRTEPRSLYTLRLERPADGFLYEQVGSSPRIRTASR